MDTSSMNNFSVLIVDDEPNNFDVLETLLPKKGFTLHYASSGAEAILALDIVRPDVILMDVMMPELSGIEVCQRIKAMSKWKGTPIIMVTALNTKEDLARCLKAGADDFISKPVNSVELRARLHSMLRIKQQYDSIQAFSKLQRNTINLLGNSLQELRGNLATSLPHEFNTPLHGILGGLKVVIDYFDVMEPEKIRQFLKSSYQSACRLEELTQRFHNCLYLELAAGQMHQEKDPATTTELGKTFSTLIPEIAEAQAEQANRSSDLQCDLETATLLISHEHLQWIVDELVNNAFKFSQAGTPVTVTGKCQDGMFHLWICDRGRGMTQQQISHIGAFMQFERQAYEQQGIGLGLRIAQKATELSGGRLVISSVYHQETTVHVTLPMASSKPRISDLPVGEFETLILKFDDQNS